MRIQPLDWAMLETEMARINVGVEYGVSARCHVQDIEGLVILAYAKLNAQTINVGKWGFCDEHRNHITTHPARIQQIAWALLPDLLMAITEEANRLATEMEHATAVLRHALDLIYAQDEQRELDSMIGLS